MKEWLFEENLKANLRNPNVGGLSEEAIITSYLFGNVPLLICDSHPWVNQLDKLKKFCDNYETIFIRCATPASIGGISVYDDRIKSTVDAPPNWYTKLNERRYLDHIQILFLKDLDLASKDLIPCIVDNILLGRWELPENVRIVATASKELPLKNELSNYFVQISTDHLHSFENYLFWSQVSKKPVGSYPELANLEMYSLICEFIQSELSKNNNIFIVSKDDQEKLKEVGMPLTPYSWKMASRLLVASANPKVLESVIGKPLTDKFTEFLKQRYPLQDDLGESRKLKRYEF